MAGVWTFDPVTLGRRECDAWVAYYRRDWRSLLAASVSLVREGFGMGRRRTLVGAWLVLRANMVWAPYPDNDPDKARALMRTFYALVASDRRLHFDPAHAAYLEVEWWRVHRAHQREGELGEDELAAALRQLYSYVYGLDEQAVEPAARHRVVAMRYSDEWVRAGCDLADPRLDDERRSLVASYTALRTAVDRNAATPRSA